MEKVTGILPQEEAINENESEHRQKLMQNGKKNLTKGATKLLVGTLGFATNITVSKGGVPLNMLNNLLQIGRVIGLTTIAYGAGQLVVGAGECIAAKVSERKERKATNAVKVGNKRELKKLEKQENLKAAQMSS